jgi:hypothetical protein
MDENQSLDFSFLNDAVFEPLRSQEEINPKVFRTLNLEDKTPETNWVRVQYAYEVMRDNIHGASVFPGAVAAILRSRAWEGYEYRGEIVKTTFREFVTAQPPRGLGTTIETLVQLCKKYPAVVEAIDQLLKEESSHGGDHKSEKIKLYNIQLDLTNSKKAPSGTSLQRSLRRLRNLAAVDEKARELREKVLRGEMSASRALKELGKQKVRYAVEATPESIAEFAKKRLSKQGLRKLKNLLE